MRKFFCLALLAASIWSCTDSGTSASADSTSADSANTSSETTTAVDHSTMNMDTASAGGQSMMSMMNGMMDNMKGLQSTGNPDNDFALMMKAHHLGAIEMAQMEVAKGSDPQMKQLAQQMIDEQQKEVAQFNTFVSGHPAHGGGDAFFKEAMGMMGNMKMDMDATGSTDRQFVQMMVPHHQSAIDMSKAYIKSGPHEEGLKTMANGIIQSQQKEIATLKAWLDKNK